MKTNWILTACGLAMLGTALSWAMQDKTGRSATPAMALEEAQRLVAADDIAAGLRVVQAIEGRSLDASDADKSDLLTQLYQRARSSGGDGEKFVGGVPPMHTRLQIATLEQLGRLPIEAARTGTVNVVRTYLDDFERLSEEQRRTSPLQALQAPVDDLLRAHLADPTLATIRSRFVESTAVEEYAKWEIAVYDLQQRLSQIGVLRGGAPAQAARKAELVVTSFASTTVPQIRQHGRRVEAGLQILSDAIGNEIALIDPYLFSQAGTPAEKYFVATFVAHHARQRLEAEVQLGRADVERLDAALGVLRDAGQRHGAGRYGARPLENAMALVGQALPEGDLKARVARALETAGSGSSDGR